VTAPEKIGLVQSVGRPGGNITGVAFTATEATYSKTLEILKEAVPTARRVAVLLGQANPVTMQAIESAVRGLKITVEPHMATEPEHLDAALAAIRRSTVDAMYVPPSGLAYQHRKKIVDFSAGSRLPGLFISRGRRRRRAPLLRGESGRDGAAGRQLRRPDPQRCAPGRVARRAADNV